MLLEACEITLFTDRQKKQEGTANSKYNRDIKVKCTCCVEDETHWWWSLQLQVAACTASVEASSTTSESISSSSSSALGSDWVDELGRQSVRLLVIKVVLIVRHVTSQAATAEKELAD